MDKPSKPAPAIDHTKDKASSLLVSFRKPDTLSI
jgi:hypothetical protein